MDNPAELELKESIRPVMEAMVFQLVTDKPEDPVNIKK